jgi:hypothetical protein
MAGCAVLHVVMAAGAGNTSGVRVPLLLVMALACVPCATHVLLEPTGRSWVRAGSVSAGMLVAHPLLSLVDAGHAAHGTAALPAVVGIGMVAGPLTAMCLAGVGAVTAGRGRGRA